MKRLIFLVFLLVSLATLAYAASGDRTPGYAPKFHIISSSTKAAKLPGEIRYSSSFIYVNISTAARPHWRRVSLGAAF